MEKKKYNNIGRGEFLARLGAGSALTVAALAGCKPSSMKFDPYDVDDDDVPTDKMEYRTNPNTGDKVSILGYGCMRWPMRKGENGRDVLDQEKINELVDYAVAHGVNYFDTAPVYCQGNSERATGIALSRIPRDKYFIATKMSNFSNFSRENSIKMYNRSFEMLQVDTIDYYLLHNLGNDIRSFEARFIDNGILDFLVEERKKGKIRNLGWSFHGRKEIFDHILAYHEKVHWDFIQIQMNYSDWQNARGNNVNAEYLYAELEKRNIPVVIMEPLLGGRLSNVPNHISARLQEQEPERSVASWAFRFVGSYPGVLTALSGMTYEEHLQDNIRTYAPFVPLTDEQKQFLFETAELMLQYPTIPCNDCKYCMPCPYGLDIPAILLHYNKCVNEGNLSRSSQDENFRKARRAFLVGYDRAVEKERQADHCVGCKQCNEHCPQRIDIPRQMRRIDKYIEDLKQGREF
ncbi:MAG: aldo/keto reductase [Rikenellaceae bacterium]|nr:aldo/keto reductase [Rikenellaceae bacterium]